MTITLSDSIRVLAERQATQAGYADVAAYLEWLVERADEQQATRAETIAAVHDGLADLSAGRVRPVEAVFHDLAAKYGIPSDPGN
jgi:predicted transcriptional regulator